MSDFDTRRIGEIYELEMRINAMSAELQEKKALAEKWVPKIGGEMGVEASKITMHFGGKAFSALMPTEYLRGCDETTVVTAVIRTLTDNLVSDALRQIVQPEVARMQQGIRSTAGAGKW